ncbi:MAG: murJ [Gammaproteobacteria bacterium]|jgi:putative peptidoglycan lipid II flippase|nr:murJ [Gammaproteobacteria bacterium]
MSKNLFKSTSIVASMTLISRIFGFVRDMVTAQLFGAAGAFDAFSVAFRIPNFMRRLFAEGSFSQAFVPVLSEYQKNKSREEVHHFINAMAGTLGFILLCVTVMGVVFAPTIVAIFAPGFDTVGPRYNLAVTLLRITFPYLMLISLTAFSGAILNTYSRFWVAALTPVFLNISMISAAMWLAPQLAVPIIGLAWGVFIAGVAQLVFQWPFLRQLRLLPKPTIDFYDAGVRKVLKQMVPALFGVSVSQLNLLLDTLFASFLIVGSVSWLYYSDRLMEFPLGIFGVAISTVILPYLSRHHASRSEEDFSMTLDWALRCVLLVGVPSAVVFAMISGPLLSTLFQHGRFDAHAVIMASKSLSMFAVGIAPFMLIKILTSGFYAKQDMRTPVRIGILAMISNMVFNFILIWPLAHAGIALATSLASLVNVGFLYYFLRKKAMYEPRAGWRFFVLRLVATNSILAIWLWFWAGDIAVWVTHDIGWRCMHLLFLLTSAVLIYLAGLGLTGMRVRDVLMVNVDALV